MTEGLQILAPSRTPIGSRMRLVMSNVEELQKCNRPVFNEKHSVIVRIQYPKKPVEDCVGNELCLFAVSEKVKNCFEQKVSDCAEFLPLTDVGGCKFYIFHVHKLVDCIDHNSPPHPAGRVFGDFIFDADKVPPDLCFRVPDNPMFVIVSPEFVEIVKMNNITGFTFDDCRWDKRTLV